MRDERCEAILATARKVMCHLHARGDAAAIDVELDESRIPVMLDDYFDWIDQYKQFHNFSNGKLVDTPKRAAFIAVATMTNLPFVSKSNNYDTVHAAMANQLLARAFSDQSRSYPAAAK